MSFGIWELIIILLIVALLFGTKRLRSMGTDLGNAIKGFRGAMKEEDEPESLEKKQDEGNVIESDLQEKQESSHHQA